MIWIFIACAILVGGLMPVQAGINARLSAFLNNTYLATFVSFFIGTAIAGLAVIVQRVSLTNLKVVTQLSPVYLIGGLLGVFFVFSALFLIQKIGATTLMIAFLCGQLITSLLIDHFGWFDVPIHSLNIMRLLGIGMLFIGLYLTVKY